ncbi:MAG TPA: HNH endonuclease signature motif containing protein, partial [Acidimicrobiales bacterium]|nr:HNH endonuclease signature motif containing protein [Acidimicrobiales bacterium]
PRRRLPTRRQQRVLDQIDHECRHPGCHATAYLRYDHIEPYARGGPTVLANLQRLCGPHNRARTGATPPPNRSQ